jgi:hypothetical protein
MLVGRVLASLKPKDHSDGTVDELAAATRSRSFQYARCWSASSGPAWFMA